RQRAEEILSPRLHSQLPELDEVAARLGMAGWTLRRRLKAEAGTRFQVIIHHMRRDLPVRYMKDTETELGEVAYPRGFSSPAAFQRAFKRWTGVAPGQYRRQTRQQKPD